MVEEHVRLRNLSSSLEDPGKDSKISLISETCNQLLIDSGSMVNDECSDNDLIPSDASLMKNIRISCDGSEVTVSNIIN